jgi:hypothetical protein
MIFFIVLNKKYTHHLPLNYFISVIPASFFFPFLFCECVDGNKYKGGIYMVFEYMDHDLTGLADRPGMRFTVPQIKVWLLKSKFIY